MLPFVHKITFLIFALIAGGFGLWGFYRLSLRIQRGEKSTELRFNNLIKRIKYAITISLTQERTFKDRPMISALHSLVFYGFMFYLLVNVIDGLEGFFHFSIHSTNPLGATYNFLADVMSMLVLIGVLGLVFRRLFHASRRDFRFTDKTLLHPLIKKKYILRDSLIVSAFISFHVGSRILGNSAKMVHEANDNQKVYDLFQPFSSLIGYLNFNHLSEAALLDWRIFGFWGALASILAFLAYFPFSKHIHLFMAPLNYALKRPVQSGVLPPMKGLEEAMEADEPKLGAEKLEDLEWPRLIDAYACIQCNRCQDVCPANTTGKALSPAALEINKRMELNVIGTHPNPFTLRRASFEKGGESDQPLLEFAINPESVWACTTCGACMEVCPVQNEQMLDIIDIRRNQVMVQGEFPQQLQTAFRGMERTSNPWGIGRDKRMEWADGLKVPTIDENPSPDVIYWVGCAASYDPGAQKVSRAFVQLLDKAGVNYAVLGKKEACTGDAARRAGNEFLYQQLAQENVETLNQIQPKLIVATCPHCMNTIGNEYKQIGGNYHTIHHTEYLELLVAGGKLPLEQLQDHVTYHDPCYLGRHNDVYDAPRNLISKMAGEVLDLEREREDSFCCGAGGAQFWKEEEEGNDRVSDNRFREIQARLDYAAQNVKTYEETGKVVAVGCPFCKSMLNSTPEKQQRDDIVVKDVAEIMLESMQRATGVYGITADPTTPPPPVRSTATDLPSPVQHAVATPVTSTAASKPPPAAKKPSTPATKRKSWTKQDSADTAEATAKTQSTEQEKPKRKKWGAKDEAPAPEQTADAPKRKKWGAKDETPAPEQTADAPKRKKWGAKDEAPAPEQTADAPKRKKWGAKDEAPAPEQTADAPKRKKWGAKDETSAPEQTADAPKRKKWGSKSTSTSPDIAAQATPQPSSTESTTSERKAWNPKAQQAKSNQTTEAKENQDTPIQKAAQLDLTLDSATTSESQATEHVKATDPKRKQWKPKSEAAAPQASDPLDLDLEVIPTTKDQESPAQTSVALDLDLKNKPESTEDTTSPTTSASQKRPKWSPKAKPQSSEEITTSTKITSDAAEPSKSTRPKWQPKAKQEDHSVDDLPTKKSQSTTPSTPTSAPENKTTVKPQSEPQVEDIQAQKTKSQEAQTDTVLQPEAKAASSTSPSSPITDTSTEKRKKWKPKAQKAKAMATSQQKTAEAIPPTEAQAPNKDKEANLAPKATETKPETKPVNDLSPLPDDQTEVLAESKTASKTRKKWQPKAQQKHTISDAADQYSASPTQPKPNEEQKPLAKSTEHSDEAKSKAETPQSSMPSTKDASSSSTAPVQPVTAAQLEELLQIDTNKPLATSKQEEQEKAEISLPETEQPDKLALATKQKPRKEKVALTSATTQPQISKPTSISAPENQREKETSSKPLQQTSETEATAHDKQHPSTLTEVSTLPNETDLPENNTSRPDTQTQTTQQNNGQPVEAESKPTETASQKKTAPVTKTQAAESATKTEETQEGEQTEPKATSKSTQTSDSNKVFSAEQQPATSATRSVYSSQKATIHKYETTPEKQKELAETEAANTPVTKGHLKWNATSRKRKTKDGQYLTKFEEKRKKQNSRKRKKK